MAAQPATVPEVAEGVHSHSELRAYIKSNAQLIYASVTGKALPVSERLRDSSTVVSVTYCSSARQFTGFVVCNGKTFVQGRPETSLTQALLSLLEATSELMTMWRRGLLEDGDAGVCVLRECGGRYWDGHRDQKHYRSSSS